MMSRALLDAPLVFLALVGLLSSILMMRAVAAPHHIARPVSEEGLELAGASAVALLLAMAFAGPSRPLFLAVVGFLLLAALLRYHVRRLSMPGILWMSAQIMGAGVSVLWAALFIVEAGLPEAVEVIALAGLAASSVLLGVALIGRIAREAVLTHERWRLPASAPAPFSARRSYKVSLHLPCYAEPPEVVQQTMDHLAALDYPDFEVLVCDNNTRDEALWRPLEEHCAWLNARLGVERFRFFHVAPLAGAKAGALNFCLTRMAPDTEIVGVVDADYLSRPDFLSRLTAFFDDPEIAYVQTPHDYRAYEGSEYLTACHWEYMPNNKVEMPGVSEYDAAFTIGTMCLLRADALKAVGGWAEWCLTEDSEVSVRLRAAGHRGVYLGETFGKGLIPDTFDDYKKQRFRWTAGPVQQLVRHWRLFLPAPFAAPMPGWTKLLEVLRCIAPLQRLAATMFGVVGLLVAMALFLSGAAAPIDVPDIAWLLMAIGGVAWWVRTLHRYRLAGCTDLGNVVRGEVARLSLTYVVLVAGVAGLSSRPLAWRRTPKFAPVAYAAPTYATAMPELRIGLGCLVMAVLLLAMGSAIGREFAAIAALGMLAMATQFLAAPYMAYLSARHISDARHADVDTSALILRSSEEAA